jgi:hypothetical protein
VRIKPWKLEKIIKAAHEEFVKIKTEWLDKYYSRILPPNIYAELEARTDKGIQYLNEEGYHVEHRQLIYKNPTQFVMIIHLYKKDLIVSTLDYTVNHDGQIDPHQLGAMIYVGQIMKL